jgi:hypothetical protein
MGGGNYSCRTLSEADDKLQTIANVASKYSDLMHDTYLAGLWRNIFPSDLLWYTDDTESGSTSASRKDGHRRSPADPRWMHHLSLGYQTIILSVISISRTF